MSKSVKDMISDVSSKENIDDSFRLYAMYLKVDSAGGVSSVEKLEAICMIGVDIQTKECLLHIAESSGGSDVITLGDFIAAVDEGCHDFEVCVALEKKIDDSLVRIDAPLIGFGENVGDRNYFAIVVAD